MNNNPIFIQIMETIENDILQGVYNENDLIISTTQISKLYNVNPTTSVKAVSKLTDAGILQKERGIGMRVTIGAREKILMRRKNTFLENAISNLVSEALRLDISDDNLIELIKKEIKSRGNSND